MNGRKKCNVLVDNIIETHYKRKSEIMYIFIPGVGKLFYRARV